MKSKVLIGSPYDQNSGFNMDGTDYETLQYIQIEFFSHVKKLHKKVVLII